MKTGQETTVTDRVAAIGIHSCLVIGSWSFVCSSVSLLVKHLHYDPLNKTATSFQEGSYYNWKTSSVIIALLRENLKFRLT